MTGLSSSTWTGIESTTGAGQPVSQITALNYSAVWAAVNTISQSIATLPLHFYRRQPDGGKTRFAEHRLYPLLRYRFNPEMSSRVARQTMQGQVLTWGNAYAEIQRNEANQVVALWPLEPHRVTPYRDTPEGPLRYRISASSGNTISLPASDMFHLKGLSYDGMLGYSVVAHARESIGAGLAMEQFQNSFYTHGTSFGGAFLHPRSLGDTAMARLRESLEARHKGASKAHQFVILEEGMTWVPTSMPLRDAQFLESRKFEITEIARWFNLPPHKLRDLERATYSNIEEQQIDYVVDTLRPWLVAWEEEIQLKLVADLEQRQQFAEHLIDGLLRGNIQNRYAAYAVGVQNGFLSANDIRGFENLNPVPGGDTYLVQSNMVPLDQLHDVIDAQNAARAGTGRDRLEEEEPDEVDAPDEAEGEDGERVALMGPLLGEIGELVTSVRTVEQQMRALPAAPAWSAELETRLATDRMLREWQTAVVASIAGRLVRRELAHVQKLARTTEPDRIPTRVAAFYTRFIPDGQAELRPWLLRLRPDGALDGPVQAALTTWATTAQGAYAQALEHGGLATLRRAWEIERADSLTRVLVEAIGHDRA